MQSRTLFAARAALVAVMLATAALAHAGDWLGGQYWGQVGGCAGCGGSLYGGGLPPGAIWVGVVGWGEGPGCGGPGCGCELHVGAPKGDSGPIFAGEEVPAPAPVAPRTIPSHEIVPEPPPAARLGLRESSRPVSYVEAAEPTGRDIRRGPEHVKVVTHTSRPERLQREPIRIVSPDGSAGRMYR